MSLEFEIAALAALIGLSGFFSGLEVALVGTNKATIARLVKDKVKGAKTLQKLKSNPGWMMSSVNLGNNLVNVGSASLATVVAIEIFGENGLGIAVGIMTFLIIIFGEVTPKTYCNANATKISLRCSGILVAFSYAFYPAVWVLERITRAIIKITGSSYHPPALTEEDIMGIVEQGHKDDAIGTEERDLVRGALKFDDTVIRSVMTPRTKLFTLSSEVRLIDVADKIYSSGHSRFPVYGKNLDDIVGILHVRDIFAHLKDAELSKMKLGDLVRKPIFVSQEKMMSDLLREMQEKTSHMAIVVDEFGGVEGVVTLEDLIEEIVGEIHDETDRQREAYEKINDDTIITNGDIEIEVINEVFGTSIPRGDDYSTLNGLLHEKLHDIPQAGDKVEVEHLTVKIEKVSNNKPTVIRIERKKPTTGESN